MSTGDFLLILDADAPLLSHLTSILASLQYQLQSFSLVESVMSHWQQQDTPIVLVAIRGYDEIIASIAQLRTSLPNAVIVAIGVRRVATALAAWRAGADDYITRPVHTAELTLVMRRAERLRATRADRALRLLNIERRVGLLEQITLDLAHEINNSLTPIFGMSELLVEDLPRDHVGHAYAQAIHTAALRTRTIVTDMIARSRGDAEDAR